MLEIRGRQRLLSLLLALLMFAVLPVGAADAGAPPEEGPSREAVGVEIPPDDAEFDGYLVKLSEDAPLLLTALDCGPGAEQVAEGLYLVESREEAENFAETGNVEYIVPNHIVRELDAPPDGYEPAQWNMKAVKAQGVWERGLFGGGVLVAVIDSGVRTTHEDFGAVLPVVNLSGDSYTYDAVTTHGTAVAGVLAARVGNAQSSGTPAVDGLAQDTTILPIRIFDYRGKASVGYAVQAIRYAADSGCDVINMSFGIEASNKALQEACAYAASKGALLVAAAGNDGTVLKNYVYPASYDTVVSVGAVENKGRDEYGFAAFSRQNDRVFIAAPGAGVISLNSSGDDAYGINDGTSFAAPAISALAALAKEQNRNVTQETLEKLLIVSAVDLGPVGRDVYYGYGLIDADRFADELLRSYTVSFLNSDVGPVTYTLANPPDGLPSPEHPHYMFDGWYADAALSQRVTEIPSGTVGDIVLYAKWDEKAEVDAVTVAGFSAERVGSTAFRVTVPSGTVIGEDSLSVTPSLSGAEVGYIVWDEGESTFGFTVSLLPVYTGTEYSVSVIKSAYSLPGPLSDSVSGAAVPASLDGHTAAVEYELDVSALFSEPDGNPLQYSLKQADCARIDSAVLSEGNFIFRPDGEDADKDVSFVFAASNGVFESAGVTATVRIGAQPVSRPIPGIASLDFDISNPSDIDVRFMFYDNALKDVTVRVGAADQPVSYTLLAHDSGFPDTVRLSGNSLKTLAKGAYSVSFTFEDGDPQTLPLTVRESAAQIVTSGGGGWAPPPREPGTVTANVKVSGGTAAAGLSAGAMKVAAQEAAGAASAVRINIEAPGAVEVSLTISAEDLEALLAAEAKTVVADFGAGTVTLGGEALRALTDRAKGGDMVIVFKKASAPETGEAAELLRDAEVYDISVSCAGAAMGDFTGYPVNIGLPYVLRDGETADKVAVWYVDGDGGIHKMESSYDEGERLARFNAPHLSVYAVTVINEAGKWESPFGDVTADDWFFEDVAFVTENGLMNGTGAEPPSFSPNGPMTRAMFVTVLHRLAGEPEPSERDSPFGDLKEDLYYYRAVMWASQNGIVDGMGNGMFAPEAPVTREQAAAIFLRYAEYEGTDPQGAWAAPIEFADARNVSTWAAEGVMYCVVKGIVRGKPGNLFDPQGRITRAEFAAMLRRL